jgi:hypothetical protein
MSRAMDITHKFAQQTFDAFNRLDLEIPVVAALLCQSGPAIKVKAFQLAEQILDKLALDYDYGNFGRDDEETRVIIKARRMMDAADIGDDDDD